MQPQNPVSRNLSTIRDSSDLRPRQSPHNSLCRLPQSNYSSRLQTAQHMEVLYHRYSRSSTLPKTLRADLKTFEKLVLKQGTVIGLDELTVLRKKCRLLQRGDWRPVRGEKHPLLTFQDAKALSPVARCPRHLSQQRWALSKSKVTEQQWSENLALLSRCIRQ